MLHLEYFRPIRSSASVSLPESALGCNSNDSMFHSTSGHFPFWCSREIRPQALRAECPIIVTSCAYISAVCKLDIAGLKDRQMKLIDKNDSQLMNKKPATDPTTALVFASRKIQLECMSPKHYVMPKPDANQSPRVLLERNTTQQCMEKDRKWENSQTACLR
jgi:hypothetical protein